jgi:hypothetical protein
MNSSWLSFKSTAETSKRIKKVLTKDKELRKTKALRSKSHFIETAIEELLVKFEKRHIRKEAEKWAEKEENGCKHN